MTTLLDSLGPAIWRASWQAAALAVVVVLLLRCFGERLAPRWRFLLWGVVLTRLLIVPTPVSPWSVFNLVQSSAQAPVETPIAPVRNNPILVPSETAVQSPPLMPAMTIPSVEPISAPTSTFAISSISVTPSQPDSIVIIRILSWIWLAGCLMLGLKLLTSARVL